MHTHIIQILNSTMGASKAFEMRKAEMRQLLPGLRDVTGDSLDPASHEEFGFLAITAPSDGILIRLLIYCILPHHTVCNPLACYHHHHHHACGQPCAVINSPADTWS